MKLKTAAKIDKATVIIFVFLMFTLTLCVMIIDLTAKPFRWCIDQLDCLRFRVGNWLLRQSDKVKDGTIKNKRFIQTSTARYAYMVLIQEMKGGEE